MKWTGVVLLSINAKGIGKEREVTRRLKNDNSRTTFFFVSLYLLDLP